MTKLLTVKRSMFFVAFLALALVGMAILQGVPTVQSMEQDAATLQQDDIAYAESSASVTASDGYYTGSGVTFGLADASVSSTTVANGPAVEGVDYQSYATTIEHDISAGAASGSSVSVNTSGYSLPLQYDTYLPASISATYNGTDYIADTYWSGTVLARAGFSTDNPDIDMSSASVSFGYNYDDGGSGGGGGGDTCIDCTGCRNCDIQPMYSASNFRFGTGAYFMPLAFKNADKSYKVNAKKWSAGETSFSSGKIKKWKSNVPHTEDLDEVGVSVDTTAIQFDAASGTLNVKQKIRIKKVKKAAKTSSNGTV